MTGRYLLAIDAGTGSCRAVLFTEQGRQVAHSLREWAHREPPDAPGGQDFDVEAGWRLISTCIHNAMREAGAEGRDVIAVAATSMREGVVLYDAGGQEIWACPNVDSRSAQEAADLIREGAAERIYAEAGDWVSITTPARLRWLARHQPGILEAARGLGMLSDWITFRLAGVRVTEPSCGSSSGMFTLAERQWSQAIARTCGISPDILPPVVDPGTVVGAVTERAAEQTGLRAGTPVVAGGADTQLGLLGAGAAAGEYTVVAGTFWQNTVLLDKPLIDPGTRLRTLCHVLPGQWMLEGIGFYCGMSMRWFRDAFCDAEVAAARARGVDPYVIMEEAAAQVPPGAQGVLAIMSNLMNARRWVHASPSFLGFDLGDPAASGRSACIRAVEEAAAYVVRGHRDIISEVTGLEIGGATAATVGSEMPDARAGQRPARADGSRRGDLGQAPWGRSPAYADCEGRPKADPSRRQGGPGGEAPRSGGPGVTPRASTVFTGGAAKGHLWPQIIADVLAVPVHVPVVKESSALGAALCAGLGAGTYASLTELEPELRRRAATFEPDPSAVAVYDERYQTWQQVYQRMIDLCDDGLLSPLWRAAGA